MSYPIYHSQYTAAQIEATLGKSPRVNATNHWEVWDINTSEYVDTGVSAGVQPPYVVTLAADMTETGMTYIYAGSEVGYNYGHWYYWDGAAWTDGGAYQAAAADAALSTTSENPVQNKVVTEAIYDTYPHAEIASTPVASFSDGADNIPVRDLTVAINAVQAGSGDPSPDNVRAISGWSAVTVSQSGEDTSDPETVIIQLGQTVYGGTLDVTTGVLTITMATSVFGDKSWTKRSGDNCFITQSYRSVIKKPAITLCSMLKESESPNNNNEYAIAANGDIYCFPSTEYSSGAEFKTAFASAQFVYELATPQVVQLSATEVKSLLGQNNIWADTGNVLSLDYRADPTLFVNNKINSVMAVISEL